MSSNRLRYDTCAYKVDINQSCGPLSYLLNPMAYENCNKCRHEFGLLGGQDVSNIKGNIVDLENDLRGQTRLATKCPAKKYAPTQGNVLTIPGNACNKERVVDLTKVHLPTCQYITRPLVALPKPPQVNNACPPPAVIARNPCDQHNARQ